MSVIAPSFAAAGVNDDTLAGVCFPPCEAYADRYPRQRSLFFNVTRWSSSHGVKQTQNQHETDRYQPSAREQ